MLVFEPQTGLPGGVFMHSRAWLSVALTIITAAPATAQETERRNPLWSDWSATLENRVAPALGEPVSDDFVDSYVDQSEYEVSLAIRRPLNFFYNLPFEIKGGVTAQPHLSDTAPQESSYYGQVTFGDTFMPLGRIVQGGDIQRAADIDDAIRAYGRYKISSIQKGILDGESRQEQQASAGVRYRDIRRVICTQGRQADGPYPCGDVPGRSWEARAEIAYLWSNDESRDRIFPSARVDYVSGPFWGGTRWVAAAMGEYSFYQNERVLPADELREDLRLRLQTGFDVSGPVKKLLAVSKGVSAEVIGRFQRNWSDRPDRRHKRLYFVPSVTFSTAF